MVWLTALLISFNAGAFGLGPVRASKVAETHRISATDLPFERVNGVAQSGSVWLVGGLRGLYLGQPGGEWRKASDQAVTTMLTVGEATWVLYGNGAVDKVDLTADKLYYDVLRGATKRPWAASLGLDGSSILFGGDGGWLEKGHTGITEEYLPDLKGLAVTAITKVGSSLWMGTQNGLFCTDDPEKRPTAPRHKTQNKFPSPHFLFPSPLFSTSFTHPTLRLGLGAGLSDLWITALAKSDDSVVVGLAAGGLAIIKGNKATALSSPTKRVRSLARWHGHLILGALDGAWLRDGTSWERLSDVETAYIGGIGDELVVGTPGGLRFYK